MFAGVPLCFLFTSWEVSVLNAQVWSSVCVSQGDHGAVWQEPERAALPHLRHGSGGVPVFRWSCVRVGFTGLCPQVRELLQLSVRQHNRKQRNPGLGSFYTTATLMLAFGNPALSNLLFPALSFLAVGGIMFLITNMQVGNLFGSRRSTIITLYNGAFDSSSALLLVIKLLYESGISLRASFLFLSACGVIHLLRTFFLLPKKFIPYPLPDDYTYGITCGKSQTRNIENIAEKSSTEDGLEETPLNRSVPQTQVKSFRQCFLSWFFLWHMVWLSVMQLRHYFFIGTLNPMLQHLTKGDPSLVSRYTNAFAITQLCGVLCAPWNGLIMDRHKGKPRAAGESEREADLRASVLSLFLTALQCVFFSVCATTAYLPLQYLTFILQVINRSFLYGGNAAFISVAFPSCHFGKLYGMVLALSAVFALLQYPCFALVKGALNGDPLYVNIALTLVSLLAFIHPLYVYLHCRKLSSQRGASGSY
ncbi:solute carrier family 43 member 3b isoform X2 [Takifugu rubripes]|uniref:solute carrier family 43 member 3b isoform X2 n=1 Tax=Takifugu rubripes TaxID=31033 RepID=UPI0011453E32|nr:solute carrier family 43 member 3-like isoform X2 [Takifugu rubripes]